MSRPCDIPGCPNAGEYRAPQARSRLDEYHWFCLEHVQAYNRAWNYYAGMSDDEVESEVRRDTVWRRPTWPFGSLGGERQGQGFANDPYGVFGEEGPAPGARRRNGDHHGLPKAEIDALAVLDLDPGASQAQIKTRYKELAKRYHPDANGGDKAAEERLKLINQAYTTLTGTAQA